MGDDTEIGSAIHKFAKKLWGIDRSITGQGVRDTLSHIKEQLPNLRIHGVPSGTVVFDWIVRG